MSNNLATYLSRDLGGDGAAALSITAYMAGKDGRGVQFTMGSTYCAMSEGQVRHLIDLLQKRLRCDPGFSATDCGDEQTVHPHGVASTEVRPFTVEEERAP